MGISLYDVQYDDVYASVQSLLNTGKPLEAISLRMIRDEMGGRGSLSTISKHFGPIKERLEHGEAIDNAELSQTDVDALRTLVGEIIERRTVLTRREKEDSAQAMADIIRCHESDLAMKVDIIDDLEHQVFALEGEAGALQIVNDDLKAQVTRLQGMVEALNATIATLAPWRDMLAAAKNVDAVNQPPAKKADHPKDGQAEMPLVTSDDAEQANVAGEDRG